jgi:hypothetical protein
LRKTRHFTATFDQWSPKYDTRELSDQAESESRGYSVSMWADNAHLRTDVHILIPTHRERPANFVQALAF